MKTIFKYAAAVALTGALAVAAATPSEARHGRNAAAGIGFVAGALVGAAVVNNGYYGGAGYGYAPGYYAEPGYAYEEPGYAGYAYEAAPVYVEPAPTYYSGRSYYQRGCAIAYSRQHRSTSVPATKLRSITNGRGRAPTPPFSLFF